MRVSRPKTQFMDFNFEQNQQGNREPVNILGDEPRTFRIWKKVVDRRLRECTEIHESQFGLMPGRSTTDAICILKKTIENNREGQKDIRVTFIDLEKAYDRGRRFGES